MKKILIKMYCCECSCSWSGTVDDIETDGCPNCGSQNIEEDIK